MSDQNYLHLEDVFVRYTDPAGKPHLVLNDIDLKVSQGELVTVVGPSGCGKSTLLRLILGSELPSSGIVNLHGKDITEPDRNRGIVFQKYSLFPHLTVRDNVAFGLETEAFQLWKRWVRPLHFRKERKGFRELAQAYLERVKLGEHGDKYPYQLSGGMRQRVAIIQSLINKPEILLMDEPFGALDDSTRQDMQLFLLELWKEQGMTIFFVTHDLEEACFLGTRILVLSQYYKTDAERDEGAKIVADIATPGPHPKSTEQKYTPEMVALIKKIRRDGLESQHYQHIRDFDLSHRDAFQTVSEHELKS